MIYNLMPIMAGINEICTYSEDTKKIWDLLHSIYLVLLVVVPILVIIFGILDLAKAVTAGKEDEIKKGQSALLKRIIAGLIVFFVASIVGFLLKAIVGSDDPTMGTVTTCLKLFITGAN